MIKPQFEVGRERLGKGGVVRTDALRRDGVRGVVAAAAELGWHPAAAAPSRLPGPAGNREYFVLFTTAAPRPDVIEELFAPAVGPARVAPRR
jgi:23S rRNA (cytidine1920-2'-O)/16S rRNA (cytidine1409-2'-O)-methyltransferase